MEKKYQKDKTLKADQLDEGVPLYVDEIVVGYILFDDDLEELPTPILPQDRGVISCPSGEVLADGTTSTLTECSLTGEWSHIAVENTCEGSGLHYKISLDAGDDSHQQSSTHRADYVLHVRIHVRIYSILQRRLQKFYV